MQAMKFWHRDFCDRELTYDESIKLLKSRNAWIGWVNQTIQEIKQKAYKVLESLVFTINFLFQWLGISKTSKEFKNIKEFTLSVWIINMERLIMELSNHDKLRKFILSLKSFVELEKIFISEQMISVFIFKFKKINTQQDLEKFCEKFN